MPAKPYYCRNLEAAIGLLSEMETEWVGRRDLETLLDVSKTVAWRLMRQCGAVLGPGSALVCRREELLTQLRKLRNDGGKIEFEVRRRERLNAYLNRIRPEVIAARTQVVAGKDAGKQLIESRFHSLPPNVSLTPGRLVIDFDDVPGFLSAVGAVIYALHNDYEKIERFLTDRTST